METAEPTDVYDFLYRDASRIASYYAQLFEGIPKASETLGQSRRATETGVKANVSVAGADRKSIREAVTSRKDVLDPHDTVTADLIAKLIERSASDQVAATPGSLVRVTGNMMFTDAAGVKAIISMDDGPFTKLIGAGQTKNHKTNRSEADMAKMVRAFLRGIELPSLFLLQHESERLYMGTVKPVGLEEPIGSFYYRYGGEAMPGVTVLGIREQAVSIDIPNPPAFLASSSQFANVLRTLFLPAGATPLIPIAIYRKLQG